jgi:hypothetical protein
MGKLFASLLTALLLPLPLGLDGIVNPQVLGNQVTAQISLVGGLGADLTITFEQVQGLSVNNLGLSARVVSLTDPNLLSRLGSLVQIPAAFPVLLRIEPPAGSLSFHGVVAVELHTHNLSYAPGTRLRLFAASLGGPFQDITEEMGPGSYRARGCKGSFSEFLILFDLLPTHLVVQSKLDRLSGILNNNAAAIAPPVLSQLTAEVNAIRTAWSAGDLPGAIAADETFLNTVQSHSGTDIPDLWRAGSSTVNTAGLLRAAGETLRFSLAFERDRGPL